MAFQTGFLGQHRPGREQNLAGLKELRQTDLSALEASAQRCPTSRFLTRVFSNQKLDLMPRSIGRVVKCGRSAQHTSHFDHGTRHAYQESKTSIRQSGVNRHLFPANFGNRYTQCCTVSAIRRKHIHYKNVQSGSNISGNAAAILGSEPMISRRWVRIAAAAPLTLPASILSTMRVC